MLASLSDYLEQHAVVFGSLAAASVLLLLISLLATPFIIARLPTDYLLQRDNRTRLHPALSLIIRLILTSVGALLIVSGLVMLVIPGPGLITLLIGLSLASFPGKRRLLRHLASRESVYRSLNWMRRRNGKSPLLHPFHDDKDRR